MSTSVEEPTTTVASVALTDPATATSAAESGASASAIASTVADGQDVEMKDSTQTDTESATPKEPELPSDASEVLYINNLNERIKLKGEWTESTQAHRLVLTTLDSHETITQSLVQRVRFSVGRDSAQQY
jgi:hypothetical protein